MAVTKRHFEAIARMIREEYLDARETADEHRDDIERAAFQDGRAHQANIFAQRLAGLFASDNATFDQTRFLNGCGLTRGKGGWS